MGVGVFLDRGGIDQLFNKGEPLQMFESVNSLRLASGRLGRANVRRFPLIN